MTFTTVRIYLCMATANCLFWLYDYILQWRIENIFRLTLKVSSVHMCLCLCLFCEWWAGLEWKWFCRGCCLNYTQAVFMCVQLCGLAEVRDLLHSTPRGLLLKTKSNTADSAPSLALSAYTHWGPKVKGHITPRTSALIRQNRGRLTRNISRELVRDKETLIKFEEDTVHHIPKDDSSWKLGKVVSGTK